MAGRTGEVVGESLEEFAGRPACLRLQDPAQGVIIDRFSKIVPMGGLRQRRNRKNSGAEDGLGFAAFGIGHAEMAAKLQVDKGKSGSHGKRVSLSGGSS